MFEHEAWYQGEIVAVENIASDVKGTPAIEITVRVSDRGEIIGHWWMSSSLVTDPDDKLKKCSMTEAAEKRCAKFGCDRGLFYTPAGLEHIQKTMIGQTAAVYAKINQYGDVEAQFIGKPKGVKKGYAKAAWNPPMPNRAAQADPFAVNDDDVPF